LTAVIIFKFQIANICIKQKQNNIMETTLQSNSIRLAPSNQAYTHTATATAKTRETVIGNPSNYYGVIAITLLIGSMVGGLVAYIVLAYNANNFLFALNVGASMTNNVAAIAQVEYKTALRIFYGTTLLNLVVLAIIVLS
jgi:hypothetical protein